MQTACILLLVFLLFPDRATSEMMECAEMPGGKSEYIFTYTLQDATNRTCAQRVDDDTETWADCVNACNSMANSSGRTAKPLCVDTLTKLNAFNSYLVTNEAACGTDPDTCVRFVWGNHVQAVDSNEPDGGWSPSADTCASFIHWADTQPNNNGQDFSQNGVGVGFPESCSVHVFGGNASIPSIPAFLGPVPSTIDVNCALPNPDDNWCFCEYEPNIAISPPSPPAGPPKSPPPLAPPTPPLPPPEEGDLICEFSEDTMKADWLLSYRDGEPNARCFARSNKDTETWDECTAACQEMSTPFLKMQVACLDTEDKWTWFAQQVADKTADGVVRYTWLPYLQGNGDGAPQEDEPAGMWSPLPFCPNHVKHWAETQPNDLSIQFETDGSPAGLPEECAIGVYGLTGMSGGPPWLGMNKLPAMMDVSCDKPNPSDVWCFCEYDQRRQRSPPPSPPPLTYGCAVPPHISDDVLWVDASPTGVSWPSKCYAKVSTENNSQSSCAAQCAKFGGGRIACPANEEEYAWMGKKNGRFDPQHSWGTFWFQWTSYTQRGDFEGDPNLEPANGWGYHDDSSCSGGPIRWAGPQVGGSSTFPWAQPNNAPFNGDGAENCAVFVFGTIPDIYGGLGTPPFVMDEDCDMTWVFTDCFCEFDEHFPPPSPPAGPPRPPPPPSPRFPPFENKRPMDSSLVLGITLGTCLAVTLFVLGPLTGLAYKLSLRFVSQVPDLKAQVNEPSPSMAVHTEDARTVPATSTLAGPSPASPDEALPPLACTEPTHTRVETEIGYNRSKSMDAKELEALQEMQETELAQHGDGSSRSMDV